MRQYEHWATYWRTCKCCVTYLLIIRQPKHAWSKPKTRAQYMLKQWHTGYEKYDS